MRPTSPRAFWTIEQYITRIVNNYTKISFNFGPTLLSWAAEHAPEMYEGIINADKQSQKGFSGHGSAMAQATTT